MSCRDNEFFRGAGDLEPTVEGKARSEEFSSVQEWQCGVRDEITTAEAERAEAKAPDGGSRGKKLSITKMLKLTAAAIITVAVASNAFGGGGVTAGRRDGEPTKEWPSITYSTEEFDDSAYVTVYDSSGRHSNAVQFTVSGNAYRLEDPSKSLSFLWSGSFNDQARLLVRDHYAGNSYSLVISGTPFDADEKNSKNAYGTISSTTGDVFYIEAISHYYRETGALINTSSELAALMHQLVVRSHITAADDGGWGKLLIGDKLYSDLDARWSGLDETQTSYDISCISFDCCYRNYSTVDFKEHLGSVTVNGILWNIYYQEGFLPYPADGEGVFDMVWFLPEVEGEECVIGIRKHMFFDYFIRVNGGDHSVSLDTVSPEMVVSCADELLSHYHEAPAEWRW